MKKYNNALIVLFSALIMVFSIYIGSTLTKSAKVDLTQEGLYSLSEGTVNILNKMQTPVKLTLYYSKTAANKGTEGIRAFNNYFEYVHDLLKEYVSLSGNNLSLKVIDPRPDTKDEEAALAQGLKKFHLTETEKYFFGLVAQGEGGNEKVIEFFDPNKQEKIEYELTKLIHQANRPKKKRVGILSPLKVIAPATSPFMAQMMRQQGRPVEESWHVITMLREFHEVEEIKMDSTDYSGFDVVVVIHPKDLGQRPLFALDQYILKGGKALILVDPISLADQASNPPMMGGQGADFSSNLHQLFQQWGVEYDPAKVAGDRHLSGQGRMNPSMPATRLLAVLDCDQKCTESVTDPLASDLQKMTFFLPGAIKVKTSENIKASPIIVTTEKGNTYEVLPHEVGNPSLLWRKFTEGSERVAIGQKIIGKFKSAFPNGIRFNKEETEKKGKKDYTELKGISESSKEGALIVIADVDFIFNQFAFQSNPLFGLMMKNNNPLLFLNAVESLSGSTDLMSVRSKGKFSRRFDVIDAIEFEAQQGTEEKVRAIQSSISRAQAELNKLGAQANEDNIAIIQSQGIKKKKELNKRIAVLKGELRDVKRHGREKIERLGKWLQFFNTLTVPVLILIAAFFFTRRRKKSALQV